jgi:predicted acyltransferase
VKPQGRLASVDALRGLTVAAMLFVNDAGDWRHVHPWFEHAAWDGLSPPDLVFPLFLFIAGVSIAMALVPRLDRGDDAKRLARQAAARALRIVLLGLALHAVSWLTVQQGPFRVMGVLQRIGLCYGAAALLAIGVRRAGGQWAVIGLLLALYAALLMAGGSLQPWLNLPDRIDTALLGAHAYQVDAASGRSHDPEGLLSTLPAIASVLLGVRAGAMLRAGTMMRLVAVGVVVLAAGAAWSLVQPLNKNLWTSSFALCTGGLSMLLLALAHRLVDQRGWPALGRSLGRNAITAYALAWLAACAIEASRRMARLYPVLFAAPLSGFEPWVASAAYALVFTAVIWALMVVFDRRGWHITI